MASILVAQVATVPIYLEHWPVDVYGLWLLLHSAAVMLPILDGAHHQYLDGEFLKTGDENLSRMNEIFWGGFAVSIVVGGLQFLATLGFLWLLGKGWIPWQEQALVDSQFPSIATFLGIYAFLWWCMGSAGGILVRYLYPLGYYPRVAWWFVAVTLVESIVPVVIVLFGGDLFAATVGFLVAFVFVRGALLLDSLRIAVRAGLRKCVIEWTVAWGRFARSLILALQQWTEAMRQQGMRLILAPLAGTAEMTHFATLRVGVNAVSQGFTAVSTPLMPELMRFVRLRDQSRVDATLATLWSIMIAIVIPVSFVIQFYSEAVFSIWTDSKLKFDPVVFALLTFGMILFAISQPAWVLIRANNLLKSQLIISVTSAALLVAVMAALTPKLGIRGAATAAGITECFCLAAITFTAVQWCKEHALQFPIDQFWYVLAAFGTACFAYLATQFFSWPAWLISAPFVAAYLLIIVLYWRALPIIGRTRILELLLGFWKRMTARVRFRSAR